MTETVLVAGAGIAGLSAAMALARPGRAVTVLDRDAAPPDTGPEDAFYDWERKGVKRGGLLSRDESATWNSTPQNVATLKKHLVQFLSLASGGPAKYDGGEMKNVHAGMRIANPEFDAVIGDLKASLYKLRIPDKEQKELLAIVESTRPLIVTER